MGADRGPHERWPDEKVLFALAQHGVVALWQHCAADGQLPRLWIPDYYCPPVVDSWRRAGIPMHVYADDPRWMEPDWRTLQPRPGDLVLAVNYFGLRESGAWAEWTQAQRDIRVVEDHSHDPLSSWARTSRADYAFASLRKTLPIPDGAIVWSPRGLSLPPPPQHRDLSGSALKLAAMILKGDYLRRGAPDKETYRVLQVQGESALLAGRDLEISAWSKVAFEYGVPTSWRDRRADNVRRFFALTANEQRFRPIVEIGLDAVCAFNAILLFESSATRDAVRQQLERRSVYAAIHWTQPTHADERVRDVGDRIMTIPMDQRYDAADVDRVVAILSSALDQIC